MPKHNGTSERCHRNIVETGLALLHTASLPNSYWSYAFQTAVYLINRLPTSVLNFHSPFQLLFHRSPNYSHFKIFGCLCYPWLRPYISSKFQSRSGPCNFLGYSISQYAYKCFDHVSKKIYLSNHVKFVEHIFPMQGNNRHLVPSLLVLDSSCVDINISTSSSLHTDTHSTSNPTLLSHPPILPLILTPIKSFSPTHTPLSHPKCFCSFTLTYLPTYIHAITLCHPATTFPAL